MPSSIENRIQKYFSQYDFDLNKSKRAKIGKVTAFTNQKCAPDVLNDIAHIILDWNTNNTNKWNISFKTDTKNSLWHYPLFTEIFMVKYGKGDPLVSSKSDYGKLLSQPHTQLVYAEILERNETKKSHTYKIKNKKAETILKFVAESMENAFVFQNIFYEKVIDDSNFRKKVEKYKTTDMSDVSKAEKAEEKLRNQFISLIKNNTKTKKTIEPQKMYLKFINNLAVAWKIRGRGDRGITKLIPRNFDGAWEQELLKYNKPNWFDDILEKPKNMTRSEGKTKFEDRQKSITNARSRSTAAKKKIRLKYGTVSEHKDRHSYLEANYGHHIIQEAHHPEFADYVENIINVSTEQHRQAHLVGRPPTLCYTKINRAYQKELLKSKLKSIEESTNKNENFYSIEKFIEILNVKKPYGPDLKISPNSKITTIRNKLS